jgi:hypothetical protein
VSGDSVKTVSRPLLMAGSADTMTMTSASTSRVSDTGRSTNVHRLPREITIAWRSFSSISRPRTKPSSNGAASKPSLISR